jgi:hypothetical protein
MRFKGGEWILSGLKTLLLLAMMLVMSLLAEQSIYVSEVVGIDYQISLEVINEDDPIVGEH